MSAVVRSPQLVVRVVLPRILNALTLGFMQILEVEVDDDPLARLTLTLNDGTVNDKLL